MNVALTDRLLNVSLLVGTLILLGVLGALVRQNQQLKEASPAGQLDVPEQIATGDNVGLTQVTAPSGSSMTLATYNPGGPTVFGALTTTCPYCEQNLTEWAELAETLEQERVPFVALSMHALELTSAYVEAHGLRWPVLLVDRENAGHLGVRSVPTTFVIDEGGRVLGVWVGVLTPSTRAEIADVVASQKSAALVPGA